MLPAGATVPALQTVHTRFTVEEHAVVWPLPAAHTVHGRQADEPRIGA